MKRHRRPLRRNRQRTAGQMAQFEQLERRNLLSALITVNSTLDSNARDGELTLREAILVNNRTLGVSALTAAEQAQVSGTPTSTDTDTIAFNIPGAGVRTITPATVLPTLTDPAVIDGYTQPGASANTQTVGSDAVLLVEIAGGSGPGSGLVIGADGSTVRGLVINRFGSAIYVASGGNTIAGNWLGIDDDGNTLLASEYDVFVANSPTSANNLIGGTTPDARNVMAGTAGQNAGIMLFPGGGTATIQGNYIGMNAQGTDGIGAKGRIYLGTPGNLVGGTAPGAGNVISGWAMDIIASGNTVQGNTFGLSSSGSTTLANNANGIVIGSSSIPTDNNLIGGTTPEARNVFATLGTAISIANSSGPNVGNRIQGNFFGTNKAGTAPAGVMNPNGSGAAIQISGGMNNVIGGTDAGAGNVISNFNTGLSVNGSNNTIQGNRIGTNAAGTAAIPNGTGIYINTYVSGILIGGDSTEAANVIAGNLGNGIHIAPGGTFNTVQGNLIGVAADGFSPLGNGTTGNVVNRNGVRVDGSDNLIGGPLPGEGNTIAHHGGSGVLLPQTNVLANQGLRNSVLGNSIHSNGGLGVDIYGNGVSLNDLNDTDAGPNDGQNFPVISSAQSFAAHTTIQGTLNSIANSTFRVEFFSGPAADPTGFGEGQTYLGSTTVTTDVSGNAVFSFNTAAAIPTGHVVSSTATGAAGNTSEFSGVRAVTAPPTLSINNIALNEGVSGLTAFTFAVTLSANPASNVTVTVNTANGSTNPATTADGDYAAISGLVLTFVPNGALTQTVSVNVAGDSRFERDETFQVNLSSPVGATLANGQGLGTILNDDAAPTLSFSTGNSVQEGNVTADDRKVPFTITLSAVSGVDVTGTISTTSGTATEGTDFASADGITFTIPAGQTTATVLVSVIEDTTFETDEQFTITATADDLTSVSNSGGAATGIGTIENDDTVPTLSIDDVSLAEGLSGITAYTFTVTLSADPASSVTVTVNTADGAVHPASTADGDYAAIAGEVLTFVPGGPLTQTVTVSVSGDSKFEPDETLLVNLSGESGATLADGQGMGTILNDDLAPTMSFSTDNSVQEGNVTADDRKVPFTITLSEVSGVEVTGMISTTSGTATEGTDFASADGITFTIPAGQTTATVLVSVIEDTTFEADEQFIITATADDLTSVSNSGGDASGTGMIENDDAMPTLSVDDVSLNEGVSGFTAFTFTVTLSANPSSNVTVTVNTANGSTSPATTADNDYSSVDNLVLTFVPGGPLTQTVTVNVAGDGKFERDETFFVNLTSPSGATLADGQGFGTILNDDLAPTMSFSTGNAVQEGNVAGDDRKVPFTISLSAVSGVDVVGTISTSSGSATEGTDFSSADGLTFTIPAGQTEATILVPVIEDTAFEPDEQFPITAIADDLTTVSNSSGAASGIGVIANDDAIPLLSIDDVALNEGPGGISAFTFTVTLSANPSSIVSVTVNTANGNVNPATTADNDYSAISGLVLTFVPGGPLTQTVTVNVTGDSKFERDETFFVNLASAVGAAIADGQGLGTVQNDDLAPTLSFSTGNSVLEGNVAGDDRMVSFTISLSAVSGVAVSGTISTASGSATEGADFISLDGMGFTIPAGQTQATILVPVTEDSTVEPDETFTIMASASDLTTVSNTNGQASGSGTILNDDSAGTPPVYIGSGCCGPALIVNGSSGNDTIRVVAAGANAVKVTIGSQTYGPFTLSSFQEVIVYGKSGNDDIELGSTVTKRAYLFGEGGNDRLKGGNGSNMLVGGAGCDKLIGGSAADVLVGGDGSDELTGNDGDDLLIAGWTTHDANFASLCAILAEWSRTDKSYSARVNNLRFGGGLNGSIKLTDQTVRDDGDYDKLTGSAGCDWFFANWCGGVLDQITDRLSSERVDELN